MTAYGYLTDGTLVKDRMLIPSTDTSYDAAIDIACQEASALVDVYITPYVASVPVGSPDDAFKSIVADFASSIFKRRMVPQEVELKGVIGPEGLQATEASGWYGIDMSKLETYIRNNYVLAATLGSTVHNPDIILKLFEKKLVTGKQARELMNASFQESVTKLENLSKVQNVAITETVVKTVTETDTKNDTQSKYHTTRQHSMSFISSDGVNTSDGGYTDDGDFKPT